MLSLLILRLACLTLQIIQNNAARSHSSLLYIVLRHQPLTSSDVEKQWHANHRHFYSYQTHNPSELMTSLCVGLDSHRSQVNLQLWHMWPPAAGVTYTYTEYSLCASVISAGGKEPKRPTVPLPFPNASGSQWALAPALNRRQWNARSALCVRVNTHFRFEAPPRVNTLLHHKSWFHG